MWVSLTAFPDSLVELIQRLVVVVKDIDVLIRRRDGNHGHAIVEQVHGLSIAYVVVFPRDHCCVGRNGHDDGVDDLSCE